jgi:hypothetical protein
MDPAWLRRIRAGLRDHEGERRAAAGGETSEAAGAAPPAAAAARAVEERPTAIGPYQVVGELGRGGAGVVYVARSVALDRLVALKVIRPERLDRPELVERFEIEARAAARLQHPGIVAVHDVGEAGGRRYLVLELVPGRSLAAKLAADGPLPPREAARVALEVARALAYAHGQRILHRDLKPANVLLDERGAARLSDFGLAKLEADGGASPTVTGQVMGTPAYMPPEQARGEPVDARSDVYGLGATLHEALSGRPPFDGATVAEVLTRVVGPTPVPPIEGLDPDLQTITSTALEKEPAHRYASVEALAADLEAWLADRPIAARRPTIRERARRWARRERAAAGALLGIGLLATLGLGVGGAVFLTKLRDESARAEDEARAAASEAERARDRAALAREALDALVDEVDSALGGLTGRRGRQARAELLAKVRLGLERLRDAERESGDLVATAEVEARLSAIAGRLEDAPGAAAAAERAVTAARAAERAADTATDPGDDVPRGTSVELARARAALADALEAQAATRVGAGDPAGADAALVEALSLTPGAQAAPGPPDARRRLRLLVARALVLRRGARRANAIAALGEAADVGRAIGEGAAIQPLLALAELHAEAGDPARAEAARGEALDRARVLASSGVPAARGRLADVLLAHAVARLLAGDFAGGLAAAGEGLMLASELARADPLDPAARRRLGQALVVLVDAAAQDAGRGRPWLGAHALR